jgi:hypothetical protein
MEKDSFMIRSKVRVLIVCIFFAVMMCVCTPMDFMDILVINNTSLDLIIEIDPGYQPNSIDVTKYVLIIKKHGKEIIRYHNNTRYKRSICNLDYFTVKIFDNDSKELIKEILDIGPILKILERKKNRVGNGRNKYIMEITQEFLYGFSGGEY